MRYQCRIAGKPAFYDVKFPGTYNARVDNFEGFWKPLFGRTHGVIVVDASYENVARHRMEGRDLAEGEKDKNVILEFNPQPRQQRVFGQNGRRRTSSSCSLSPQSPTSRRRLSQQRGTTAAFSHQARARRSMAEPEPERLGAALRVPERSGAGRTTNSVLRPNACRQ
jgi:hypothetical protein